MYVSPELQKFYKKQDDPLEDVSHLIDLKQQRIVDAGREVPAPHSNSSILRTLFDYLDRSGNAVRTGIYDLAKGRDFFTGLQQGLTRERTVTGEDLMRISGVSNPIGKSVGGFIAEMALDPLNWFGGALAKGLAKGARAVGAPTKVANVIEHGPINELLIPAMKDFGKGVMSKGLNRTGHLDVDEGSGIAGALGRAIGSIGTDTANIGRATTKVYDTIGSLLNNRFVKHGYDPSGLEGVTSHAEGKALLREGMDLVADSARKTNYLQEKFIKNLEDTPLAGIGAKESADLIYLREAPVHMYRRLVKEQRNLRGAARQYSAKALSRAGKVITGTLDQPQKLQDEIIDLRNQLQQAVVGSPDFTKIQKKLAIAEDASRVIDDVKFRAEQEIRRIAGGNLEYENYLRQGLDFLETRSKELADLEDIPEHMRLPNYIYHTFEGTPKQINSFLRRHPEMARLLSPNISAHKKRTVQTYRDLEKIAEKLELENKEMLIDAVERSGKAPMFVQNIREAINENPDYLKTVNFDDLLRRAKNLGVTEVDRLDFNPVIRPSKDAFAIQVARELDGARNIVRTQLAKDLETKGLLRKIRDNPTDSADPNRLLESGWIKTDSIPGYPKGYAIHPEIARAIKNMDSILTNDENLGAFLDTWNKVQNMWKLSVTALRPAWYLTNLFGNVFTAYLGGLTDVAKYGVAGALQAGRNMDSVLRRYGIRMTSDELLDAFRREGLEGFGEMYGDVRRTAKEAADEIRRKKTGASVPLTEKIKGGVNVARKVGDKMETNAKLALFIDRLSKNGNNVKEAAEHVRTHLFDYTDITKFERGIKTVVPFYTFTRKNLPLQLKSLVTQPHKYMNLIRAQEASMNLAGVPEEDRELMPSYFRDRAFGLPFDGVFFTPSLPSETLSDFAESPANAVLNMISPLLKTPLVELPLNVSTFTGQPIERYEGELKDIGLGVKLPAKLAFVLQQIGAGRDLSKAARSFSDQSTYKGRTSPVEFDNMLLNILSATGAIPATKYDAEQAKLYEYYDYNAQLDDFIKLLKAQGIDVRTMTDINKEKKALGW